MTRCKLYQKAKGGVTYFAIVRRASLVDSEEASWIQYGMPSIPVKCSVALAKILPWLFGFFDSSPVRI